MNIRYKHWKILFQFGLGLAIGAAFCMKWMEKDLWAGNERFTILGLEWFYSKEEIEQLFALLDDRVSTILRYHLYFDFAFMAGVYPSVSAFCMFTREKCHDGVAKKLLYVLALSQVIPWLADIGENYYLLKWMDEPRIGREFAWYHFIVAVKWIIVLAAIFMSATILVSARFRKRSRV